MSGKRYPEEFKIQAVEQVTKQGHSLTSVAERLGISYKSLSDWVKRYGVHLNLQPCTLPGSKRKVHVHKGKAPALSS